MNVSAQYGGDSTSDFPETETGRPTTWSTTASFPATIAIVEERFLPIVGRLLRNATVRGRWIASSTSTAMLPTTTTTVNAIAGSSGTSGDAGQLSSMAIHFIVVGCLFVAVLLLAVINAYLHFRSERRTRRMFSASQPPPDERSYMRRSRRSGRRGADTAAAAAASTERRIRMTVRMKPTKMFTV